MRTSREWASKSRTGRNRYVFLLRRWLLVSTVILLCTLALLMGYQRHRASRLLNGLPKRLGMDIRSETNGFTYSQSVKGRVLFTIHAAKAIQRENGKTTLHDVLIVIHGPPGSNQMDSIRGDEFEYDQINGVIRAVGEVHLDLVAPDKSVTSADPKGTRLIVTTRGLVFLQKLGIAATNQPLQITYGELHGSADGADYESDTGLLRLRNDVHLDGVRNGKILHLAAAKAELDQRAQTVTLHSADVQADASRARGDSAIVAFTKDGVAKSLLSQGHVSLDTKSGEHLNADRLQAVLASGDKLQQLIAEGKVHLKDERYNAEANSALVSFDVQGKPAQADLRDTVQIGLQDSVGHVQSEFKAPHARLLFATVGVKSEISEVFADGGAYIRSSEQESGTRELSKTGSKPPVAMHVNLLTARELHAATAIKSGQRYISMIDGQGETHFEQSDSLGNRSYSTADTFHASLEPTSALVTSTNTEALRTLVQKGNVRIVQHRITADAQGNHGETARVEDAQATAQIAEWDSVAERLNLSGDPALSAPGVQLMATHIVLLRRSAEALAEGNVRGTFQQGGDASDVVHVSADHGRITSGVSGSAEFDRGPVPVRLWTSAAQLEATHVDVQKATGLLIARGSPTSPEGDVRLILSSQEPKSASTQRNTMQVRGREITLVEGKDSKPSHIDASGDVRLVSDDTDVRANTMVATLKRSHMPRQLQPARTNEFATDVLRAHGELESIVASGSVRLWQPGRTANGDRLVYTAADDLYRLVGDHGRTSFVHDSLRGDINGSSLLFNGSGDRVGVLGLPSGRVQSQVPVPTKRIP